MRNSEVGGEAQLWLETTVRFHLQGSRLDYEIRVLFLCDYGIFSGSILFRTACSYDLLKGVDVQTESEDGNPGTFNAFACGGALCGVLVLIWDLAKGALAGDACAPGIWEWMPGRLRW